MYGEVRFSGNNSLVKEMCRACDCVPCGECRVPAYCSTTHSGCLNCQTVGEVPSVTKLHKPVIFSYRKFVLLDMAFFSRLQISGYNYVLPHALPAP